MGVGYQGLQLALMAKRRSVNFDMTVTIGRQNHYLDAGTLRSMFRRFGLSLSQDEENEILKDSYSEGLFKKLGSTTVDSIDASAYEGANIIHDLNNPIDRSLVGRYTCVVDFGSLEHIYNFPGALKNATDLVDVGGHFLSMTTANNFMGHGFYQFSPELFFGYLPRNGFVDVEVYLVPFRIFPFFFRVADPAQIRGRVELVNREPVLIAVMARKARHIPDMIAPMQSDYYQRFWQGRDVDRGSGIPRTDQRTATALRDLLLRMTSLMAWPETISPRFVEGCENALHYQLIDPAKDVEDELTDPAGPPPSKPTPSPPSTARKPDRTVRWHRPGGSDRKEAVDCFNNRGILIPIVPQLFSEPIAESVRAGHYESHEVAMLDALIQPGEVILEVGAGCGFISSYCAKNPHTRAVHCVEANPNLIDVIKLTHELNDVDVTVYHELLAKQDGEADFYLHADFWASGTHSFLGKPVKVRTTPFQRRLAAVRPTMLIIDIEGGEESLFEDVDLNGVKKIMVELHQPTIGRHGMKKVFDLLSAQNFHYEVWHSAYSIVTFSHVER